MKRHLVVGAAVFGLLALVCAVQAQNPAPLRQGSPRVFLGITVEPPAGAQPQAGVVVHEVTPDSPAAQAGLKPGDVITNVGDQDVRDFEALLALLAKHKAGDKLAFHVRRGGQDQQVTVTLAARQDRVSRYGRGEGQREKAPGFLGVQTQPPQDAEAKNQAGAVVADVMPNTPAAKAGLERGDVITSVDGKAIAGPDELRSAIQQAGAGKEVRVTVQRGQQKRDLTVRLEEAPVDGLEFPFPGRVAPGRGFPGIFDAGKIQELERKVQELEKRVRELERKPGG